MQNAGRHRSGRIGWLRAAVLGANDGIVSTASLVVGIAAAGAKREDIVLAGVAGLVAGALSMAAGEYVSVSSQADTEQADLAIERTELATPGTAEQEELAAIYVRRGLEPSLAQTVAQQLMTHDALGAHARDELGHSDTHAARPLQAALASAATFAVGAGLPMLVVMLAPQSSLLSFSPAPRGFLSPPPPRRRLPPGGPPFGVGGGGGGVGAPWRWAQPPAWECSSERRCPDRDYLLNPAAITFCSSRNHNTELATMVLRSQSPGLRATVENACCRNGI